MSFDYIIVGGGPTGLTLAYYLSRISALPRKSEKNKILLIDSNESLGGCHTVYRINGLFAEHSPRIYSTVYKNFINILKEFGYSFEDLFTPYKFTNKDFSDKSINDLNKKEISILIWNFIKLIFIPNYGSNITVLDWCNKNNFSKKATDFFNRLCLIRNGASNERTRLLDILQLMNQGVFDHLYLPKKPNDISLFKIWEDKLLENGVTILKNKLVTNINVQDNIIQNITLNDNNIITGKKFLFCIPPESFFNIIKNNLFISNTYPPFFKNWINETKYIPTLTVVFHFDTKLDLNNVWGFPYNDWGIIFIIMSNYMEFNDDRSKTVISCNITLVDSKSSFTNKTPLESSDEERGKEVFRQIKDVLNITQEPTYILSYRSDNTAYVRTTNPYSIPFKNSIIQNLYTIGTQNDKNEYATTSFETAIENALQFLKYEGIDVDIKKGFELLTIIRLIIVLLIIYFLKRIKK